MSIKERTTQLLILHVKGVVTKLDIKKAHNISNNITRKEFISISTNNESDNNNKNIEVDQLEVKHAKEQE